MSRPAMISALFLAFAACADAPTSPAVDVAPDFGATTTMAHFAFGPAPAAGIILCTQEAVSGWTARKGHTALTVNNKGFRLNYHSQYQLELVGTTGRRYNGHGVTNQNLLVAPGSDYYIRVRNKLIAQGEDGGDDDFFFTQVIRLHVTPNGDVQQSISETKIECR